MVNQTKTYKRRYFRIIPRCKFDTAVNYRQLHFPLQVIFKVLAENELILLRKKRTNQLSAARRGGTVVFATELKMLI